MKNSFVLGIWDGHDAGAALLEGEKIVFAVNEERLSRRKLEVGFPHRSIAACLAHENLSARDISEIAVSTSDPAKTLTRIFPGLKEEYYLIRRRKKDPSPLDGFKKWFKYRFTELEPNLLSGLFSRITLMRDLEAMGFNGFNLGFVNHHKAHAHTAARLSGFDECLVLTLDGVGDGLSGSIWRFKNKKLHALKMLPAKISLGIFFEHVTNLMNMRELEDEGKVMALANYAYPVEDDKNPLIPLIRVEGLDLVSAYSSTGLYREMKKILWRYPSEQFAYMAQRALEKNVLDLVKGIVAKTGARKISVSGGVFSNVKLNMKIGREVERLFVFPHMGDGGLGLGAAMDINEQKFGVTSYGLDNLYLGPKFKDSEIVDALGASGFSYRRLEDVSKTAADLILSGEIILWFQGRMEIGPRALGNRSILARPDDRRVKDHLNLLLKKRVWYQPFCPSMLFEDAPAVLETDGLNIEDNRFMTTAFKIRSEYLDLMEGVMNIDGTCRPQLVRDENPAYRALLLRIKEKLGRGIVLNTSLNIHGEPIVCSPRDALEMLRRTGIRYLLLEDYLVGNNSAKPE